MKLKRKRCTEKHHCPTCGGKMNCARHRFVLAQQEAVRELAPVLRRAKVEEHWMVWLDDATNVVGRSMSGRGSEDTCRLSLQQIVRDACANGAYYAVAGHNHPESLWPEFSPVDKKTSVDIARALNAVGVRLLDDLVMCRNGRWLSAAAVNRALKTAGKGRKR